MQAKKTVNDVEAACFLGLKNPQTLRNWRFLRKGPPYSRIGRRIVYQVTDLQEYLDKNKIYPEGKM